MVKIPMIFTGSREIKVERIGKVSPEKGKPFVTVKVPLDMATNLSRDKYWAWAKAETPVQKTQLTQPNRKPEEKKAAPVEIEKVEDKEKDKTGGKKK